MYRHSLTRNSILDYVLWSDPRSGHFTQLRTYVPHELEWQTVNPFCFSFCYATVSFSFPSQNMSSSSSWQQINITGNETSFALRRVAVIGTTNDGVCGSTIFLVCTPLKYNYAISLTDAWHSGTYLSQIRDSCGQSQDILLLTGTKRPPLWSSGQSFWLQIQRSRVRFPALPDFSE